ncbi:hypothetical protein NTE_01324 [Candidatus Nitrososphaera evergladensis SR1]|uniref:Uncharacterized protein n=1 Tax=Candidatus Nitrososphaera evergladensis SR1 TaxID=1459636 RepID=A0A075MRF0_9ARCH|nr:hypothetical protein NTE_01324 [Candidatus Nitrososphaera evergladensis SR1]
MMVLLLLQFYAFWNSLYEESCRTVLDFFGYEKENLSSEFIDYV